MDKRLLSSSMRRLKSGIASNCLGELTSKCFLLRHRWIMSLASASLLYFRSSLDWNAIDLLLIYFRRSVCRLFSGSLLAHRVECCEILHHQPMFHPVSSCVSTVECLYTNTCTLNSVSRPQLSVEVSSNNWYAIFAGIRVLLNCSVHFLDVTASIPWVEKITTHQLDALKVYQNRCCDGWFVDVFAVNDFLSPPLIQHDSNSVFVVVFFLLPWICVCVVSLGWPPSLVQ